VADASVGCGKESATDQLERDPFAGIGDQVAGWTRATRTRAWAAERSPSNKASLGARRHVGPMGIVSERLQMHRIGSLEMPSERGIGR